MTSPSAEIFDVLSESPDGTIGLDIEKSIKAIASRPRLLILEWLKDPASIFPPHELGDPVLDGACNQYLADRLGVAKPTASRHLKVLVEAGLIIATPRSGWVFYRRNEASINRLNQVLSDVLINPHIEREGP